MADNRYRRSPPPVSRRYITDPRASTGTVYSSSFDPSYPRGGGDPYPHTRHSSIYDTQPVKKYSYQDSSHGPTMSSTHYSVRPRTNSNVPSDGRRPLSMIAVKNTSPTRSRPLVSNSLRDDPRSLAVASPSSRDDSSRYLIPASSHGREHHQRHYSATRADIEGLKAPTRSARSRPDYHPIGGYSSKAYPASRVKDDDYSYTGPREQFARDYPSRPAERRDSQTRRERPVSVYDLGTSKDLANGRRDLGPPPAPSSRQLDRPDGGRLSVRPAYESDPERGSDLVRRRHPLRAPVVHQGRDDGYKDYLPREDLDLRPAPRPRRDRIIEEDALPTRPRKDRVEEDDLQIRPRRERIQDEEAPARTRRDRIDEELLVPVRRRERVDDEELVPRPRRDRIDEESLPKVRSREPERDLDRDREVLQDRDRDRVRGRDYIRERDRERETDRLKPAERSSKHPDDQRGNRSRENSPQEAGHGKAVAAGLGSLAAAGLAGAAIKGSQKPEEDSDSESRRDRRHRNARHRDREDEGVLRESDQALDRKTPAIVEDRDERLTFRRDEPARELADDEYDRQRIRRQRQRDADDPNVETSSESKAAPEPFRPDRNGLDVDTDTRRRSRHSRVHEPDPAELEQRTMSPGEEEDDRPRRVQLVEPVKDREDVKPKGILKAPRMVPFPEDPNPTREGVAPLKEAGKDGVPPNARWTKISRVLVNPEALEKAHERFEERDEYVIVLRVVTREEIEKLATKTKEIREARAREWQEELEQSQTHNTHTPQRRREGSDADEENGPRPLLDQVPANPSFDPRVFTKSEAVPNAPVSAMPVPDIKLEDIETNYSTNV